MVVETTLFVGFAYVDVINIGSSRARRRDPGGVFSNPCALPSCVTIFLVLFHKFLCCQCRVLCTAYYTPHAHTCMPLPTATPAQALVGIRAMASTAKQPGSRPRNRCRICRCRERRAEQRRVCAGSEAREAAEAVCKVDSVGLGGHLHLLRSPRLACLAAPGRWSTRRTIRSHFGSRRAGLRGLMGRPELVGRPWLHRRARGSAVLSERRWVRGRAGQAPRRRSGRVK